MALEALDAMAEDDLLSPVLLGWIERDMPRDSEGHGVEVGFMRCMGVYATVGRQIMGDDYYRQWMADGDAALIEERADAKAKRSEQARAAANKRWSKARAA